MALIHKISEGLGGAPSPEDGTDILHFRSINSLLDAQERGAGDRGGGGGGGGGADALARLLDAAASSARAARPTRVPLRHTQQEEYGALVGSPEVAQTPRALVPAGCFPPHHTSAYASYSEVGSGLGGGGGSERDSPGGASVSSAPDALSDLVKSLTNITIGSLVSRQRHTASDWTPEMNGLEISRNRHSICLGESMVGNGGVGGGGGTRGGTLAWTGKLPPRCTDTSAGFSSKVFLGGLPWDITEEALLQTFRHYHPLRVEWPGKEGRALCAGAAGGAGAGSGAGSPRGYAYVTFESERRVRALLADSSRDHNGNWYYRVSSRKMRSKDVQVIPWAVADSNFVAHGSSKLDVSCTVFVGALHGMLCAGALAAIMHDLFAGVVYVGIDTDKNKYPIGSGRVTFNNRRSYIKAVNASYIEICTDKFTKKVQIDPYLEESVCSVCNIQQGPYFCREPVCFQYFCRSCWIWKHSSNNHSSNNHKALTRNYKSPAPASQPQPQYASVAQGHASAPVGAHGYSHPPTPRYTNSQSYNNSTYSNGPANGPLPYNGKYSNGPGGYAAPGYAFGYSNGPQEGAVVETSSSSSYSPPASPASARHWGPVLDH